MKAVRTPEERFRDLVDFDFAPHYGEIDDGDGGHLRMAWIDEGPRNGAPVLCLHGEPSWSYLYRKMIPIFTAAGHRVLAPDLVGFGRSDKPVRRQDYSYQAHVDWMSRWLLARDLRGVTLVCQDWGGLIGLRLWAAMPDRFARIVVANTALPTGDQPLGPAFEAWRDYSQKVEPFRAGRIVHGGTHKGLTEAGIAAYDAPFPEAEYLAGARQFPMLVPATPDDPAADANRQAWAELRTLHTPVLTAFGAEDKVMAGADAVFQKLLPGARGQDHVILPAAGHFLQEDVGPELAALVTAFIARAT